MVHTSRYPLEDCIQPEGVKHVKILQSIPHCLTWCVADIDDHHDNYCNGNNSV